MLTMGNASRSPLRCDPFGMPAAARDDILKVSARRNVFSYEPPYGVSLKGLNHYALKVHRLRLD